MNMEDVLEVEYVLDEDFILLKLFKCMNQKAQSFFVFEQCLRHVNF
jgi:hypothetical protein